MQKYQYSFTHYRVKYKNKNTGFTGKGSWLIFNNNDYYNNIKDFINKLNNKYPFIHHWIEGDIKNKIYDNKKF